MSVSTGMKAVRVQVLRRHQSKDVDYRQSVVRCTLFDHVNQRTSPEIETPLALSMASNNNRSDIFNATMQRAKLRLVNYLSGSQEQLRQNQRASRNATMVSLAASALTLQTSHQLANAAAITDFVPLPLAKAAGRPGAVDPPGRRVVLAGESRLWPVALFWAVTGAHHSEFSPDSGVCIHPAPRTPENLIVTFMAGWDHSRYGWGRVWTVPSTLSSRPYSFRAYGPVPGLFESEDRFSLPNIQSHVVTAADLLGPPVLCRPDETLIEMGYHDYYLHRTDLPLRGPHEPFDERYACGATGGHLYVTPNDIFLINNFGVEYTADNGTLSRRNLENEVTL